MSTARDTPSCCISTQLGRLCVWHDLSVPIVTTEGHCYRTTVSLPLVHKVIATGRAQWGSGREGHRRAFCAHPQRASGKSVRRRGVLFARAQEVFVLRAVGP